MFPLSFPLMCLTLYVVCDFVLKKQLSEESTIVLGNRVTVYCRILQKLVKFPDQIILLLNET